MNSYPDFTIDDAWILARRGEKNAVDPLKPYACLVEKERTAAGMVEDVATIFLTNKECPFRCLMCDLWKNTTDKALKPGFIPKQIKWALQQLPSARHIKLYNSGNFFDRKAIPQEDYLPLAGLISGFKSLTIECHPKLINDRVLDFKDMIVPELEIAIGLETVHPDLLQKLNKRMSLKDFEKSVGFLAKHSIRTRAFLLLRPPFLSEEEGVFWAKKSIDFAFDVGVECCVIIPVRPGNGAMDWLQQQQIFSPPQIHSLEEVMEYGIQKKAGRVFADLWDLELFSSCPLCFDERRKRLHGMNMNQQVLPLTICKCSKRMEDGGWRMEN